MYSDIYLYGIFDTSGVCKYIGQTTDPRAREYQHLEMRTSQFYKSGFVFRIIRGTTFENANRLERQIGNSFKRRGLANHSKCFGRGWRVAPKSNQVCIEETGTIFDSLEDAAKWLDRPPTTVKKHIGKGTVYSSAREKSFTVIRWPDGLHYEI